MSENIGFIYHSGSKGIDLEVTKYWGGNKVGKCYQLTGPMENREIGYVQLSIDDVETLFSIVRRRNMGEEIKDDKWHAMEVRHTVDHLIFAIKSARETGLRVAADWDDIFDVDGDSSDVKISRQL